MYSQHNFGLYTRNHLDILDIYGWVSLAQGWSYLVVCNSRTKIWLYTYHVTYNIYRLYTYADSEIHTICIHAFLSLYLSNYKEKLRKTDTCHLWFESQVVVCVFKWQLSSVSLTFVSWLHSEEGFMRWHVPPVSCPPCLFCILVL